MNDEQIPVSELPPKSEGAQFSTGLQRANVVFAVDKVKGTKHLVYGVSFLDAIAQGAIPAQQGVVMAFAVDFSDESDDLEFLCAAVKAAKGSFEYQGEDRSD